MFSTIGSMEFTRLLADQQAHVCFFSIFTKDRTWGNGHVLQGCIDYNFSIFFHFAQTYMWMLTANGYTITSTNGNTTNSAASSYHFKKFLVFLSFKLSCLNVCLFFNKWRFTVLSWNWGSIIRKVNLTFLIHKLYLSDVHFKPCQVSAFKGVCKI